MNCSVQTFTRLLHGIAIQTLAADTRRAERPGLFRCGRTADAAQLFAYLLARRLNRGLFSPVASGALWRGYCRLHADQ